MSSADLKPSLSPWMQHQQRPLEMVYDGKTMVVTGFSGGGGEMLGRACGLLLDCFLLVSLVSGWKFLLSFSVRFLDVYLILRRLNSKR